MLSYLNPLRFISGQTLHRYFNGSSYKKSFQYRILNYFENQLCTQKALQQYQIRTQVRNEISEVKTAKHDFEIIKKKIHDFSSSIDQSYKSEVIKDCEKKCLSIMNHLEYQEILSLLNVFLRIFPDRLLLSDLYQKSLVTLLEAADNQLLNHQELVQLLFFVSLMKEKGAPYIKYMQSNLPDFQNLSLIEKCIIAQAFYKSSVKLQPNQSRILEKTLEDESENLIFDNALLVCLCKAIRISKPSRELNLTNLSENIVKLKEPIDFTSSIHILSLYAEALINEANAINKLVKDCIEIIKDNNNRLRLKDFDRFLWSISRLNFILTPNQKETLKNHLEQRLREFSMKKNLGLLVNSILCLHILKVWNTQVIIKCFKENILEPVFYDIFHWKVRSRLQLLMSQIAIELQLEIPQPLQKQIKIAFVIPDDLHLIADVGRALVKKGIALDCTVNCPINTLLLPGVTLTTEQFKYHIDILNQSTCLRGTNLPYGYMALKSRLLDKLQYRHILIKEDIFKDEDQTKSLIEKEMLTHFCNEKMKNT